MAETGPQSPQLENNQPTPEKPEGKGKAIARKLKEKLVDKGVKKGLEYLADKFHVSKQLQKEPSLAITYAVGGDRAAIIAVKKLLDSKDSQTAEFMKFRLLEKAAKEQRRLEIGGLPSATIDTLMNSIPAIKGQIKEISTIMADPTKRESMLAAAKLAMEVEADSLPKDSLLRPKEAEYSCYQALADIVAEVKSEDEIRIEGETVRVPKDNDRDTKIVESVI